MAARRVRERSFQPRPTPGKSQGDCDEHTNRREPLDHRRGDRHLAVLAPFAIEDAEDPAFAVDVLWPKLHGFTHAQAAVIDKAQDRLEAVSRTAPSSRRTSSRMSTSGSG